MTGVTSELFPSKNENDFPNSVPIEQLPNLLGKFFVDKVEDIRTLLDSSDQIVSYSTFEGEKLERLKTIDDSYLEKLISSRPIKLSTLDALPPSLFRLCLGDLIPVYSTIINDSLASGSVPKIFKEALVHPLLKKEGLDIENMKNYRPVSNLLFDAKLLERVVDEQLQTHVKANNIIDENQSAYKKDHSCETALLYILNNLLFNADSKKISLLTLLDLSAAFDTIDHRILIRRLEESFGIAGTALAWFESYLSDRSQRIVVEGHMSDKFSLKYGVPQGSVLGPVLFSLYTQPLSTVIRAHHVEHHKYADDTQLLKAAAPTDITSACGKLEKCIGDVKVWMSSNKLKLNGDKTELLASGTKYFLKKMKNPPSLSIDDSTVEPSDCVRNLGVFFDKTLSMHEHISSVCKSANYELRKIASVRRFLTFSAVVQLVSSLVLSRLDYCNSLFVGLPDTELSRLQNVMNNAARMIFGRSKHQHVTPLLHRLHWLPVKQRITYKIATLAFRKFDDSLPRYLSDLLTIERRVTGRTTRSSHLRRLLPPPLSRNKTTDERLFSIVAPEIWNRLPSSLRDSATLPAFKAGLKTHLFREACDEN